MQGPSGNATSEFGRTFSGWVPTITGHLSFSLIGLGASAVKCVTANIECSNPDNLHVPIRHVAVSQRRITRDLPLTAWPIPIFKPWIASEFILIGSSQSASRPRLDSIPPADEPLALHHDNIGVLTGRVLVVPHHEDATKAAQELVNKIRARAVAISNEFPRGTICGETEFAAGFDQLLLDARREGVVAAEAGFELFRSGELRLTFSSEEGLVTQSAQDADGEDFIPDIAKQIYYFIKDISHRHYHHDRSSDNLLPISETHRYDDENWRRETLWALARAVLETRRRNHLPGHKSALGILAYAEAFQQHLARVKRLVDGNGFQRSEVGEIYDFSHTRSSLDATIDELSYRKSFFAQLQALAIGSVLAAAALWLTTYQVRSDLCDGITGCVAPMPPTWLRNALHFLLTRPLIPIAIFFTGGVFYFEISRRSLQNIRTVRNIRWFVASWAGAAGASASRYFRQRNPVWGDTFGSIVAFVVVLLAVSAAMYVAAGLFGLLPFPYWLKIENWLTLLSGQ